MDVSARDAVEKVLSGERGKGIEKAVKNVIALRAAREALKDDSSTPALAPLEREKQRRERAETLALIEERLTQVENAEAAVKSMGTARDDLKVMLKQSKERINSLQAAVAGGATSGCFALPQALLAPDGVTTGESLLHAASVVVTGALFALTYRYCVSCDRESTQLKAGAVLAFAITRSLGHAQQGQLLLGSELVYAGQSLLLFGFVSAALEYCFRNNLVSLFDVDE